MSSHRVIGIDLDDVLLGFNEVFSAHNRNRYASKVMREDIHSFNQSLVWGIPQEEAVRRTFECYDSPEHADAPPMPGAVEGVRTLCDAGYELHIITSKPDHISEITAAWVGKRFPGCFKGIHFTNQFHGNKTAVRTKSQICRELGATVLIDDAIHNATEVAGAGIDVLLLDCPWNRQETLPERVRRVHSWEEIVELLK